MLPCTSTTFNRRNPQNSFFKVPRYDLPQSIARIRPPNQTSKRPHTTEELLMSKVLDWQTTRSFALGITSFLLVTIFSVIATADEFKAGAAQRIFTPDPLLPISGGMGPGAP